MRHSLTILLLALLAGCAADAPPAPEATEAPAEAAAPETTTAASEDAEEPHSAGYDPAADPAADLQAAVAQAADSGQRILLEVGGEWCSWCHLLEKFIHGDAEISEALARDFIVVKVNYSDDNKNEAFLGGYPEIKGYPHIFVLDQDGTLLHSQDTAELEEGKGYNRVKFLEFLGRWAPPQDASN